MCFVAESCRGCREAEVADEVEAAVVAVAAAVVAGREEAWADAGAGAGLEGLGASIRFGLSALCFGLGSSSESSFGFFAFSVANPRF